MQHNLINTCLMPMNSIPRLDLLADFDSSSSKRSEVSLELISETLHCFALAVVLGVLLCSGSICWGDGVQAPFLLLLLGEDIPSLAFAFCLGEALLAAAPLAFGVLMVWRAEARERALLQSFAMLRRERERERGENIHVKKIHVT